MSRKAIAKVAQMMNDTGLMEINSEYSALFGLFKRRIHLSKQNICIANAATGAGNNSKKPENPAGEAMLAAPVAPADAITSPMVGVVYLSPEPSAKPFAPVGKKVAKGDTLCLIEAMKTFNPIKAHADGEVMEILVKDGETVEFGTPLIVVR
jgi:acetyl-CoA carboxylase biotin carboxyl carrier protein